MLRRNDIVVVKNQRGFTPARVWRRIDKDRVQIISVGQHIDIFRDDELELSDYKGTWKWQYEPGNPYGNTPRWVPMSSLRRLKYLARDYNPHFGGYRYCGHKWTKEERQEALAER